MTVRTVLAPLTYYRTEKTNGQERLLYAPTLPALLEKCAVKPAPNIAAITRFLATGASDEGASTFFEDVHRVPAGYEVVHDGSEIATQPCTSKPHNSDGATAVRAGDGAAGAALLLQHPDALMLTTSFGPMESDEDEYIEKLTDVLGARQHHSISADTDTLMADISDVLRSLSEPVAHPAAYLQFLHAREASRLGCARLVDPVAPNTSTRVKKPLAMEKLLTYAPQHDATEIDHSGAFKRVAAHLQHRFHVRVETPYVESGEALALPENLEKRLGSRRASLPVDAWLMRLKNRLYELMHQPAFAERPWWRAPAIREEFESFIRGRCTDAEAFWRILLVELWAQEFLDEKPLREAASERIKAPLEANAGKQLEIDVDGVTWVRNPIRTGLFAKGDDIEQRISCYVTELLDDVTAKYPRGLIQPWYLVVSEKIVAISQGRSYFVWEITPSWWARMLSRYVVRTPYGIGLGSPWTMQLAIQEAGLARILCASAISAAGKVVGKRGLFYRIAGSDVRAIDGPTEYSVYPANVSAKLPPAAPGAVATSLRHAVERAVKESGHADAANALAGVVVIDANDIGRNVLGMDVEGQGEKFFEEVFADNPLGQGSQQTPLAVVFRPDE